MSAKTQVVETGVVAPPTKPSIGARIAAHFKRWWWAHLIAFVAMVLVIVLPVIYVAYPKIAQHAVNASSLKITTMKISNPTPESFRLEQTQVIGSDSKYHPRIYAFDADVSLGGAAAPFTTVRVPEVKSQDGTEVNVSQMVTLSDLGAFGGYAKAVMLSKEVGLNIYGRPDLKEGALPTTTVTYNKTVTMKGLNRLKGFDVTEFHILLEPVNGRNMNGTVLIPNPTVMTIEMGNLTLDLSISGQPVGQTFLENLVLKPGNNSVSMTSTVDQVAIIKMLTSKTNVWKTGVVPFDITGNSSVYNGKELPYFTKALSANNLTVNLDIFKALAEIGIDL